MGEAKNRDETRFRFEVCGFDGRVVRTVRRVLEEEGWSDCGETYCSGSTGEDKFLYEKSFEDAKEAKHWVRKFPYKTFYIDRNNKEVPWNMKKKRGRPRKNV